MLSMERISGELVAAKPYFKVLSPKVPSLFAGKLAIWAQQFMRAKRAYHIIKEAEDGCPPSEMLGEFMAGEALRYILRPAKVRVLRLHSIAQKAPSKDFFRKNGMGGRTWISEPGRYKATIVFHDANRVGPHVDVHIGRMSVVYRVKPDVYEQLKHNSQGYLTQNSQKLLLEFIRSEIDNRSRVPQNLDHSVRNAQSSWVLGDRTAKGYGAGFTRQVIAVTEVDVVKAHVDGPIEMYMPFLNPYRGMYMFRLHPGDDKKAPILIWGNKVAAPPTLDDRLHLKLIHPEDLEEHQAVIDYDATTAKYDGSSAYIVIGPKGAVAWSPRVSVVTGQQIEYTHKISGLAPTTSDQTIIAMGEVMFRHRGRFNYPSSRYVPQSIGGGVLNSNAVTPSNVVPEVRLYRVDKVGRQSTVGLDFWANRELQHQVAQLNPEVLKVVDLMTPEEAAAAGFEGVVTVPFGAPITDGFKTKWWSNAVDWRIDNVGFRTGPKGSVAGVVTATSLESGNVYKLGPGQVGNQTLTKAMMNNPGDYEGAVLMVHSRHGHEGRAARVIGFHDDKGVGVPY